MLPFIAYGLMTGLLITGILSFFFKKAFKRIDALEDAVYGKNWKGPRPNG